MTLSQKYSWMFTAATILTSSFLVAKTTNYFVEGALLGELAEDERPNTGPKPVSHKSLASMQKKNGQPIVDRNVFNSAFVPEASSLPTSGPVATVPDDTPPNCDNPQVDSSGATLRGTVVVEPK